MLLDTYAWVEYFNGTAKGETVRALLREKQCFTSAISLAELSEWCARKGRESGEILGAVKKTSIIIGLDNDLLEAAGRISHGMKCTVKGFGMLDAIILATSRAYSLPVVTGDRHFAGEEGAVML
ncbi:MAG: PIN domain-containing protein [Candidatus Diapherotrites archaeon]